MIKYILNTTLFLSSLFAIIPIILSLATPGDMTMNISSPRVRKVLVTGAAGKTGKLVLQQLQGNPHFFPVGLVRTQQSKEKLLELSNAENIRLEESQVIVGDICNISDMEKAANDVDALIICTSATPAIIAPPTEESPRPVMGFPNGQPELIDWIGQKNQIDAAKKNNLSHVVICSSMGGTNPGNMLNNIGRTTQEDGKTTSGGNILLWKRKAEKYLMDSGLTYTIVHPGGLLDTPGSVREIVVGVDDEQLETSNRSIPRADVARLLIASLIHESYKNRSFDARTKVEGDGTVTTDLNALLVDMQRNCDYSLGVIPE